jgi:apolipoprotein D and lipocalin family protein
MRKATMRAPIPSPRRWLQHFLPAAAALLLLACAGGQAPPLAVAPQVDLARYMGTWHEIASYPTWFQKGCAATTATYALNADGTVAVLNQCRRDGEPASARGTAWAPDPSASAKLKVRFFWPFSGDYWIIDLGPDYEYAVVGHPGREYLWILSRTPQMEAGLYARIIERLRRSGYDPDRLVRTPPA